MLVAGLLFAIGLYRQLVPVALSGADYATATGGQTMWLVVTVLSGAVLLAGAGAALYRVYKQARVEGQAVAVANYVPIAPKGSIEEDLLLLQKQLDKGQITPKEYVQSRQNILNKL